MLIFLTILGITLNQPNEATLLKFLLKHGLKTFNCKWAENYKRTKPLTKK